LNRTNGEIEVKHGFKGPHVSLFWPSGNAVNSFRPLRKEQMRIFIFPDKRQKAVRSLLRGVFQIYRHCLDFFPGERRSEVQEILRGNEARIENSSSVEDALGIEGVFHRELFALWAKKVPAKWHFVGRNRRPPMDPINAFLSYGNSIIYGLCVPPLQKEGFNTTIGFLHQPRRGRHTLALDMAELFKPVLVETVCWELIQENRFSPEMARWGNNGCFLGNDGKKVLRTGMFEMIERMFGNTNNCRFGWPVALWVALEKVAQCWKKDILNEHIPERWEIPGRVE
jgi:CRISPR-associated protein Cas1